MLPNRLSARLRLIRWVLPAIIALFGAMYQVAVARYVQQQYGDVIHYGVEILLYSLIYPVLIWLVLGMVHTWVDQKERAEAEVYRLNTELQARVDERTHELSVKAEALTIANERLQELDGLKSEFVSLVSHELRAPLTNVRGAVELMHANCLTRNSTCVQMFKILTEQISRLGRLVDNVLNVSRIESGGLGLNCSAVDAVQVAEQAVHHIAAHENGRVFRWAMGAIRPIVWADASWLYDVVANLLDNAAKYSPAHSEVVLDVRSDGGSAVISVSDNGPGIPAEQQEHIFEKFYRLDSGDAKQTYGYGLGLYLCRHLVEAMKGRIWVESEPGRGATFHFVLPLAATSE